jgi:hypothetical protein
MVVLLQVLTSSIVKGAELIDSVGYKLSCA